MKPKIGVTCGFSKGFKLGFGSETDYLYLSLDYIKAVKKAGGIPIVLPPEPDFIDDLIDIVDGVLITGGGDIDPWLYGEKPHFKTRYINITRDIFELELTRKTIDRGKPVLGVCRGIQVINVALGGTLIQDIDSEVDPVIPHNFREGGKDYRVHFVEIDRTSRLYEILGVSRLKTNSFHHQAVKNVAEVLRPVAWTEDGIIEAVESKDKKVFILGVQWHPETMLDDLQLRLFKALVEAASRRCET
ncbi:MAG: gamma-glutamyl-gamma-aminobutyrate hydrolase family protein [Thermoproteales archaeon]|nr:gamma-glutamyl-gamma-aminobutyrate hydrolase family protein [Thermoproteales archaeon]RLE65704.1 MAG: gamma-glutamyl-gamma-aminobutyrate hydrolase family protein [Thermoprotei archaeon]